MAALVESDTCVCPTGSEHGVKPIHVTASQNVEIWGACAGKNTPYTFGCNHILLAQGESATLPDKAVAVYNSLEGPHYHIRSRLGMPHAVSKSPWEEVKFTTCKCKHGGEATPDEWGTL